MRRDYRGLSRRFWPLSPCQRWALRRHCETITARYKSAYRGKGAGRRGERKARWLAWGRS